MPARRVAARLDSIPEGPVSCAPSGIQIGGKSAKVAPHLLLAPEKDGSLHLNGRRYRGQIEILEGRPGKITAINILPLEDYLCGVLGSEVILAWPAAALQAQAIVSRTYALHQMGRRRNESYDVVSDTLDQSYKGMEQETDRARAIVRETRGVVLAYGRKIFATYYHSTCGGRTAAVSDALQQPTSAPLSGVACGFCQESRYYQWSSTVPQTELVQTLARSGRPMAALLGLHLRRIGQDGRVGAVELEHTHGRTALSAVELRRLLGPDRLRSTCFQARLQGQEVHFQGRGWGHGVGLCQWGAQGMASLGHTVEAILHHYYPGAELMKFYP